MDERNCLNCGFSLKEEYTYCPSCGQKDTSKVASVRGLIVDFLGDYFTFDSKIFKSLKPLLLNPGVLTLEYLEGKRVSYIPPLRLYIFISIFFFVLFAQLNPNQSMAMQGDQVSQDMFDYFIDQHMHKVLFVLLPVFALILYIFYHRAYKNYFVHFIFSLHFHAFMFFILGLYLITTSYVTQNMFEVNQWVFAILQFVFILYLFFAFKKVYKQRIFTSVWKLITIVLLYAFSFIGISIISFALYYFWNS